METIFFSSIRIHHLAARFDRKSEPNFSQNLLILARTHKNSMPSADANNDDCICNAVVTEKSHCDVGHSNILDSGDAMGETKILSVQDPSKKARSLTAGARLR